MSSTEPKAYEIMTSLDVDYVLVIFGGLIGYSGDDINKFLWMVRIAEGEHPQDIRVSDRPAAQCGYCQSGHFLYAVSLHLSEFFRNRTTSRPRENIE